MRSVNDITDLSVKEVEELINVANDIIKNPEKYRENVSTKSLQLCFLNRQQEHALVLRLQ